MSTPASVCAGVSLERAYYQSDVVMEVELKPEFAAKREKLSIVEGHEGPLHEHDRYTLTGFTLDVKKVWKGKHVETTLIYVDTTMTLGYHFEENQQYVVFASFFDPQIGTRVWQTNETREQGPRHKDRCRTCRYLSLRTRQEHNPLYTSGCRGNAMIREDSSSVLIKAKLDRIREESFRQVDTREHSLRLSNFVRGVLESNKERTSALENASPRNDSFE